MITTLFFALMQAQTSESFGGNIVLGRPTDRSITVNVLFTADHDSVYLEYGVLPGALAQQTQPQSGIKAGVPYQEVIAGLAANRRYYYRVRYRKNPGDPYAASAEHRFQTQRAAGSTYTFTLIADSHLFTAQHCLPERYAQTLTNAKDDNPDFHIDLGDTFRTDTIANRNATLTYPMVLARAIAHRPFFGIVTADAPLFLVLGNHDSEYLYYTRPESGMNPNLPLWSTNARVNVYPNPLVDGFYSGDRTIHPGVEKGGQRQAYYAWEWGDALFVALDPYWVMPAQNASNWVPVHGDAQYLWLRDTLRNSKARYKFVMAHHVLGQSRGGIEIASQYEWGGTDPRRQQTFAQARPGWDRPIHQLFVETGVTAFFQGHDHLYARAVLDGVTYLTVPMPGAGTPSAADYFPGNTTTGNFDAFLSSLTLPNSGHVRVEVAPTGVKVEYVTSKLAGRDAGVNKQVADSFVMKSAAPPGLALVNAASYIETTQAPGSLVTAFGTGFTADTRIAITDSSGRAFTVEPLTVASTQTSFVIPAEAAPGNARASIGSLNATVRLDPLAPALFSANATGRAVAAATAILAKTDGTQTPQPVFRCGTTAGSCVATPLDRGGSGDDLYLTFYGTGFRNRRALTDVVVWVGGQKAEVLYAGAHGTYAGLDQLNVKVNRTGIEPGESGVVVSVEGRFANVITVNLR